MRALSSAFFVALVRAAACLGLGLSGGGASFAEDKSRSAEFPLRIEGDAGAGLYATRSIVRGKSEPAYLLPYGYFDYGRAFMRIDTLGIKTAKMGYGYLELVGRVSLEGFKADTSTLRGLSDRGNPVPLGVGTLQETPIGAFFLNAFRDVGPSKGSFAEAIYVAEIATPKFTIYPQVGAEYQSKQYAGYLYGITPQEATASGYGAYRPGGAFNPFVAVLANAKLGENLSLNFYLRHKWLDNAISGSPIVDRKAMDTVFVSLAYRFK